ncbi:MAG: DNA-directed RNA polymerase subunit alpha [Candidatus Yonathbacteria bacterium CG_4_10_14_3_um_filter_47_65]|uniref:DNA-directed RNA polymerase subunit alpha n=1 Tax=Candidatus Yonathbacteria bacterium CG_4_9_14_0_8_um_filter_46_47 TaxID=1975106 RepID=A0A2M8D5C2_9BACT|nr:MAG: DNA-directed RNA polymerase subunit alpha [Candidatus Yonathbacteria bacterium CG23_combo_of_CG06-09_8_20_14_all_46_18]PIQ32529.1 MAG: DNA-directed RNA polymerase subunit alpha [Candidatus Yonathbacteria bacterium CG17_big_fil_post_rev_8_21_14_2_50_46_19]PIX56425.1 MAG: DNA-directed RNA polymerase subunit alpha [Candidatus Yonathbacteria bacterium CG_4_10_14_3_um_filter_47_65]PIY57970.1 MAG: DNA-directed RNA polymerase subunit alpha [Candidatus Yonathbacteria bacterium CG_4_10_14_0_8_um_
MTDHNIILPSKPRIINEDEFAGVYEIDGLYPGYGHTLGNSLRRIILSSLPGTAITSVKIAGVPHEFSTIEGVKEDVVTILVNLKKVRFEMATAEPQVVTLSVKGVKTITAGNIKVPGQVTVLNKDLPIADITAGNASLDIEMVIEKGLGYISKETHQKDKVEIGTIALDAIFTPIKRVNYEVEKMRVGDRTDYNRLKITIETDGSVTPKEALERSIEIMISQLQAVVGFKEENKADEKTQSVSGEVSESDTRVNVDSDSLKTRVDDLGLSTRTLNALETANIRTIGGLARKKENDLLALEGLGAKGVQEIKRALSNFGIILKES